jgi:hypothetical protein
VTVGALVRVCVNRGIPPDRTRCEASVRGIAPVLKTLVNTEVVGKQGYPIGPDAVAPNEPSKFLVEIAFGLTDWDGRAGLYLPMHEGQSVHPQERVTYRPTTLPARSVT